MSDTTSSAQHEIPSPRSTWASYPFDLVPGDPEFRFPAAEGSHDACESDTWFIAGELTGTTGRRFAFLTIFNKNRPGGTIVADFYTMALFDIDNGTYGTYTDYDMPPKNMARGSVPKMTYAVGHLDASYDANAGTAIWRSRRDAAGELIPYTYEVHLVGIDHDGSRMELHLDVSPTKPPVPVGGSRYNGRFACMGQAETFSYFQTGLTMSGSLSWGDVHERVSGSAGHIDRQWFPVPPGSGNTGRQASVNHEWRTIHLDNGVDIVGWRHFDRQDDNAVIAFTGATVTVPGEPPLCVEDVEVCTTSYVRWPESIRQLTRPLVAARYMPDRHTLSSRELDLYLTAEPLVALPAHGLPVEYMEGPFLFRGTMRGEPVSGFGISERSLALYRDWELADVLEVTAGYLGLSQPLTAAATALRISVRQGQQVEAMDRLTALRAALASSPTEHDAVLGQLLDDMEVALSLARQAPAS